MITLEEDINENEVICMLSRFSHDKNIDRFKAFVEELKYSVGVLYQEVWSFGKMIDSMKVGFIKLLSKIASFVFLFH